MSASPLPCAPNAVPAEEGAIQRGVQKAKAEAASSKQVASLRRSDDASAAAAANGNSAVTTPQIIEPESSTATEVRENGDGHVEVSLDTPPSEVANPLEDADNSSQYAQVAQDDDSEGFRTPTQSNGNSTAFASRSGSPIPEVPHQERTASSSSASWSDIITAATDHTDEHVTK